MSLKVMLLAGVVSLVLQNVSVGKFFMLVLAMILFFVYSLYANQENILYQPKLNPQMVSPNDNPLGFRNPREQGMNFENVTLKTPDGQQLHAWWIPAAGTVEGKAGSAAAAAAAAAPHAPASSSVDDVDDDISGAGKPAALSSSVSSSSLSSGAAGGVPAWTTAPTVLWLSANAGNMGWAMPNLRLLHERLNVNIFALSYRGYGNSTGTPSEQGIITDAETALMYLASKPGVDPSRIVVFGRSLGGAVAFQLAARHERLIRALVLENTFTGISDMVDSIFPFLRPVKRWILRIDWGSARVAPRLALPLLFISGRVDEVVPSAHMDALCGLSARAPCRVVLHVPDGMHNDTWIKGGADYVAAMRLFLAEAVLAQPAKPAAGAAASSSATGSATAGGSGSSSSGGSAPVRLFVAGSSGKEEGKGKGKGNGTKEGPTAASGAPAKAAGTPSTTYLLGEASQVPGTEEDARADAAFVDGIRMRLAALQDGSASLGMWAFPVLKGGAPPLPAGFAATAASVSASEAGAAVDEDEGSDAEAAAPAPAELTTPRRAANMRAG